MSFTLRSSATWRCLRAPTSWSFADDAPLSYLSKLFRAEWRQRGERRSRMASVRRCVREPGRVRTPEKRAPAVSGRPGSGASLQSQVSKSPLRSTEPRLSLHRTEARSADAPAQWALPVRE